MRGRDWLKEEEDYLKIIASICIKLSKQYHVVYFKKKKTQTKLKIPAIIIGSFTGVASFGTTTFPKSAQKWVAIVVGLVNIGIATLNTLETFFKIGEDMNSSKATSEQLRKLAEDIDKELCLPEEDRPTSGIQFLRDTYTRYQQIISNAPMLLTYISYADKELGQEHSQLSEVLKKIKTGLASSKGATPKTSSESQSPKNLDDAVSSNPTSAREPTTRKSLDKTTLGVSQIPSVATYLSKQDAKISQDIETGKIVHE